MLEPAVAAHPLPETESDRSADRRMNVLHVILSRGFAGSERSTAESCNAQAQSGLQVTLAVLRRHRSLAGASIIDQLHPAVCVVHLPGLGPRMALRRLMQRLRPDIVHAHLHRATDFVATLPGTYARVATLHLDWNRPGYLAMDGIICNARWQVACTPPGFRGLVFKANNSLVPEPKLTPDQIVALRRELGAHPGDFLVGGVGRMTRMKGWDQLLEAFRVANLPNNARLAIVGEGRRLNRLRRACANDPRICLPGYRDDAKRLQQAFDLLVCPSRFEPLPRVLLEALDAGTPIIASDTGGCREIVEDYGGDLFALEDIAGLAALLERRSRRPPERRTVNLEHHHLHRTIPAMTTFYRQAIEHRR